MACNYPSQTMNELPPQMSSNLMPVKSFGTMAEQPGSCDVI